jgi:tripartite-type tricarboxylate transporter receptor subunit TctC
MTFASSVRQHQGASMLRLSKLRAAATMLILCGLIAVPAGAQTYPHKPVRFVVPYVAGGNTDVLARLIGQRLAETLGQSVIVDNRPAIDGVAGIAVVTRSAPDGYTLLMVSSSHAINTAMGMKLPYDALKDLAPITQTASQQLILTVHPSVPAKTVRELIAYAKSARAGLNYGTSSSATQLATELFDMLAGIKMTHIPYKGSAPMMNDLLGGQIEVSFSPSVISLPHVKSGKVRALAIGDSKRSAFMPDLPTVDEAGVPGYQAVIWTGMLAPAQTPRPIIERLNKEVVRIVRSPDLTERLVQLGSDTVGSTPEQFDKFVRDEIVKWTAIAKKVGLRAEN